MKTRQKILLGFSVPLLLMITIAVVVYTSITGLLEDARRVQHTQEVIQGGQELINLMVDMETGERGFLITGKEIFLDPFKLAQTTWDDKIGRLKSLVADNPTQVERLDKIDELEKQWLEKAAAVEIDKRRSVPEPNKSLSYMQNVLRKKVGKGILDEIRLIFTDINKQLELSGNQQAANLLLSLSTDIVDQETGQRGYLITGEDSFLEPYIQGQENFNKNMSELRRLLEGGFEKKRVLSRITELEALVQKWTDEAATPEIKLRDDVLSGNSDLKAIAQRLTEAHGKGILDSLREALYTLEQTFVKANNKRAQVLVLAISKDMVDRETGQRGYLITGKKEFLQPYENGSANLKNHIARLRVLVNNGVDKDTVFSKLESLQNKVQEWRERAAEPEIDARREITASGVSELEFLQTTLIRGGGKKILDEIRFLLTSMERQFDTAGYVTGSNLVLKIAKAMVDQETGERGFLITGEESFLAPFVTGKADFDDAIVELRVLLKNASNDNSLAENVVASILGDVVQVHQKGKEWLEKAANPEIATRRQIDKTGVQTLQFIQKVLIRASGKNILDEIRAQFAEVNDVFVSANHLKASYYVLALKKAMVDQETGQRGYLITGDDEFLQPYKTGLANFRATIPKLKHLVSNYYDIAAVLGQIEEVEILAAEWRDKAAAPEIDIRRQVLAGTAQLEQIEVELSKGLGKSILDKIRTKLTRINAVFELAQSETGAGLITAVAKDLVDQETGQRGFLITGKESFLQPFNEGGENLINHLGELRKYVESGFDKHQIAQKIEQLRLMAERWRVVAAGPEIAIRKKINTRSATMNDVTALIENETGKNIVDAIRSGLAKFTDVENSLMKIRVQRAEAAASNSISLIVVGTIAALLIALIAAYLVSGNIVKRLEVLLVATKKVSAGDLSGTIHVDSKDEIGQLALEFDGMTSTIRESRDKMQNLLEEAQRITEELESQQEELKSSNEELEEQTQALKASEEELKAQSEELQQSNEALEEKSDFLERQTSEIEKQNRAIERSRQELIVKADELEISSKYKSEFLANMSHELRTPLNSLLILSKSLADNRQGNLTDDQVESASTVHAGGEELLELINDILDLSKVEAGKLNVHIETVAIDDLWENLARKFRPLTDKKGLELKLASTADAPESIKTDSQRTRQILKNLLSNAVKFTSGGSVTVEVHPPVSGTRFTHSALTIDTAVGISVTDTGIGIAEDKQREIFEAFQQADGSTSRKYGGTGLGLTISRELARLLGGEIQLQSKKGVGSTFTLYLPLDGDQSAGNSHPSVEPQDQSAVPHSSSADDRGLSTDDYKRSTVTAPGMDEKTFLADDRKQIGAKDKSLLIIEDDPTFARILLKLARKKGFKCLSAGDGNSGLQLASKYQPSGIILDLGLPDIDGLAILDQLKNDLYTRHIPVHIMSARDARTTSLQAGALNFLNKPVTAENIEKSLLKIEDILASNLKRLLVIEDDDSNRKAIVNLIKNKQIEITDVADGQSALDAIVSNQFDCIILDLSLPDMTGFEFLQKLEKDADIHVPPVIIHTGRDLSESEYRELDRYADSIVIKGASSPERLLDEASLFLHSVASTMPKRQREMIRMLHEPDQVLRDKRILLVDDDVRNGFALSRVLRDHGIEVILADNGQLALERLEENGGVELVLMDIMMPVMDGHEAMRKIRQQTKYKDLPIIALTALAMPEDRAKCIESGANDYLSKPVDVDKLLSMMRIWLFSGSEQERRRMGRPWEDGGDDSEQLKVKSEK